MERIHITTREAVYLFSFQQNQADFRAIQEASLICRHIAVDDNNVFAPVLLGAFSSLSLSLPLAFAHIICFAHIHI